MCHELPNWYPLLAGRTPRSTWLPIPECFDSAHVLEAAASFGSAALIVKDYVKSRKHEWSTSCFIPDASDTEQIERVTSNFLARQGESLVGGLVLREFVSLRVLGTGTSGAAPLVNEWRLFRLGHRFIACAPHTSSLVTGDIEAPPLDESEDYNNVAYGAAEFIPSNFYSMDVAQLESGAWIVIELGDGGVSGLPPQMGAEEFYASLKQALT